MFPSQKKKSIHQWPALLAQDFNITAHLLHMPTQVIGKLMLATPFEPHWGNLAMPLTSRGISTGLIPYDEGMFSIEMDFIDHVITCSSTHNKTAKIKLRTTSVADLTFQILTALKSMGINTSINMMPQEVSNPVPFDQDTRISTYDEKTVNAWWQIMMNTYLVLQQYHACFSGITPAIGLFWGTLDLRDARYKGTSVPITKATSDYITRNSLDDAQVEVGFSSSNEKYPYPSFFAFAYPKPEGFENAKIEPKTSKWIGAINEFVLDYEDLRNSRDPETDLLAFFTSSYQAVAKLDHWDPKLVVKGKPV